MQPNGYTRRSSLAGSTIPRTPYATVRGSVRRRDPDGVLGVPYFDLGAANTHLLVNTTGDIAFDILFPDRYTSMQAVLDIINGALTGAGQAYDLDGVLHLRAVTAGGAAFVEVQGGDAAAPLGFDTSCITVRAKGGEIAPSPQGRAGNPFSTAFPVVGENLSTKSFVQALGRLAGNMDELYATIGRPNLARRSLETLSSASQSVIGNVGTIPLATTLFVMEANAYSLGDFDSPEGLAGAFLLIDPVTRQPPASRIVGLTLGGNPAYGQRPILQTTSISVIKEGRYILDAPGTFSSVVVGNYVEVTNTDELANVIPWDHRGWWCVEGVASDGSSISLRPLSVGELNDMGYGSYVQSQRVLELNDHLETGKTYGSMAIYNYPNMQGVSVQVSPPLPPGMTVDLYGPDTRSVFERPGSEGYNDPSHRALVSQESPLPDAVLTAPVVTVAGANIEYTEFYARKSGRRIRVPAGSVSAATVPTNSTLYALVWSTVSAAAELRAVAGLQATDLVLAKVWNSGTLQAERATKIDPLYSSAGRSSTELHVGNGQEFPDIYEAVRFLQASGATKALALGATIVLHETQVMATTIALGQVAPSAYLKIRGASGTEKVRPTAPNMTLFSCSAGVLTLHVEGVGVDESSTSSWRWCSGSTTGTWYFWEFVDASGRWVEWARSSDFGGRISQKPGETKFLLEDMRSIGGARPLPTVSKSVGFDPVDGFVAKTGSTVTATLATTGTSAKLELTDMTFSGTLTPESLNLLINDLNADSLHTHKALEALFTIGGVATSANVTAANLNALTAGTSSDATALHRHAVATGAADGFMAAADKATLDALPTTFARYIARTALKRTSLVKVTPATAAGFRLITDGAKGSTTGARNILLATGEGVAAHPVFSLDPYVTGITSPARLSSETPSANCQFYDAARISESAILVAGTRGNGNEWIVAKRTDAGVWTLPYMGAGGTTDYVLYAVATDWVPDGVATRCVAVGGTGQVVASIDGGTTWAQRGDPTWYVNGVLSGSWPTGYNLLDVAYVGGYFIAVGTRSGGAGIMLRIDHGISHPGAWSVSEVALPGGDPDGGLHAVAASGSTVLAFGTYAGGGALYRSTNAGASWSMIDPSAGTLGAADGLVPVTQSAIGVGSSGYFIAVANGTGAKCLMVSVDDGLSWDWAPISDSNGLTPPGSATWKLYYNSFYRRWFAAGSASTDSWLMFSDPI